MSMRPPAIGGLFIGGSLKPLYLGTALTVLATATFAAGKVDGRFCMASVKRDTLPVSGSGPEGPMVISPQDDALGSATAFGQQIVPA
jgi:hypothetical protein